MDVASHPKSYPLVSNAVSKLLAISSGNKIGRYNDLLRSLNGRDEEMDSRSGDGSLHFNPVFSHDRELAKLLRDAGGHASKLAFIKGVTDLIVDDEKTRGRSPKASLMSLVRSKSAKAFGPVGNCVNLMNTGIPLSCHYSHHGESSTDIVMANLSIIEGVTNNNQVKMGGTVMGGDRGYNNKEYFEKSDEIDMDNLNTRKRGPSIPFSFGNTYYKTSVDQRDIPENGPFLVLGATQAVGLRTSHLVAYCNGTGRVTFLQSTMPSLSYGNIDFCTEYGDHDYARTFEFAAKVLSLRENYKPDEFLSDRVLEIRVHFDLHNVFKHTQRQNGIEWHGARANTMTSTVDVLPTEVDRLNAAEQSLISDDIGKRLTSQSDADESEEFLQYQDQSSKDLHKLTVKRLQDICKHYQHPYSNRRKTELVDQVKTGPNTTETITEQERFLKKNPCPSGK